MAGGGQGPCSMLSPISGHADPGLAHSDGEARAGERGQKGLHGPHGGDLSPGTQVRPAEGRGARGRPVPGVDPESICQDFLSVFHCGRTGKCQHEGKRPSWRPLALSSPSPSPPPCPVWKLARASLSHTAGSSRHPWGASPSRRCLVTTIILAMTPVP